MLLLGVECAVKVFDVQSGLCRLNVTKHEFCAVGGVAWMTNSKGFFSGGQDARVLCWVRVLAGKAVACIAVDTDASAADCRTWKATSATLSQPRPTG